jgi:hypothetical protein
MSKTSSTPITAFLLVRVLAAITPLQADFISPYYHRIAAAFVTESVNIEFTPDMMKQQQQPSSSSAESSRGQSVGCSLNNAKTRFPLLP